MENDFTKVEREKTLRPHIDIKNFKERIKAETYPEILDAVKNSPKGLAFLNRLSLEKKVLPLRSKQDRKIIEHHDLGENVFSSGSEVQHLPKNKTDLYKMMFPEELFGDEPVIATQYWPEKNTTDILRLSARTLGKHEQSFELAATIGSAVEVDGEDHQVVDVFEFISGNLPKNGVLALFMNFEKRLAEMGYEIVEVDNSGSPQLIPFFMCRLGYVPKAIISNESLRESDHTEIKKRFDKHRDFTQEPFGTKLVDHGSMVQVYGKDPKDMVLPQYRENIEELEELYNKNRSMIDRRASFGKFFERYAELFLSPTEQQKLKGARPHFLRPSQDPDHVN